jgi:SAM-dependent methyltransferase
MHSGQIKSRERVANHGEVLTGEREVTAMLDLVKQETLRIESRFLEPACGTGNFLDEILRRKLTVVTLRYERSQFEWERAALLALTSLYGIDILEDNVQTCRARLFERLELEYLKLYAPKQLAAFSDSCKHVLRLNIIWGDALSLKRVDDPNGHIIFSEWSPVNGSLFKRRDFIFKELFPKDRPTSDERFGTRQKSLFGDEPQNLFDSPPPGLKSDTGDTVFIPQPVIDFPVVHYLELAYDQAQHV